MHSKPQKNGQKKKRLLPKGKKKMGRLRFGAPKCPNRECSQGRVVHWSDRESDQPASVCRVCGGAGTIPEAEYRAWMQDPAFVASLAAEPRNYGDFYKAAYRRHMESAALAGRMPTTTLLEFVALRRAEQRVPPINHAFVRAEREGAVLRMRCLAECFDGRVLSVHDQGDTSYPCAMCAPYGGRGTIPASHIAAWMSDPGYRAYCARTPRSDRRSYESWRAQAAREAPRAREPAREAPRAREPAREAPARQAQPDEAFVPESTRPCIACLANKRARVFVQCGHVCYCGACAQQALNAGLTACPECRTPGPMVPIFMSFGRRTF